MSTDWPNKNNSFARHHAEGESFPETREAQPVPGAKRKVLIVDDEIDLRTFLLEFCALNGYEAECAGNGLAALEHIGNPSFKLVIVDYLMPGINGVEFVRRAKERRPDLPIIAMSAWYDTEPAFLEAGAYKFMKKPFDPYQLEVDLKIIVPNGGT